MSTSNPPRPAVLCILDGWGTREETDNNAIALADTPVFDRLIETAPHSTIDTDGVHVGLPAGQMGNSEVGHMNLGSGRVVLQDLPQINEAVETGALAKIPQLQDLIARLKDTGGACHLMGLLSPGGVHAHQDHIAALANIIGQAGVPVRVHAFLDGRDTPPRSAEPYLNAFLGKISKTSNASIATVSGRYFAMDRDKRWDRVEKAWATLVRADGLAAPDAIAALNAAYGRDENDEFVTPTVIGNYAGMVDGDGLLMANFRADRARELLTTLVDPSFHEFDRGLPPIFSAKVGMVEYSSDLNEFLTTMFPAQMLTNTLGEVAARLGLKQLRIAETEKYAHVTFFFNGGREEPFEGEDRILIPSPKVKTYDLQPEMSAAELTDRLVGAIDGGTYDLIIANFANPDMVGHTGDLDAAKTAVATVDKCLGRIETALKAAGGIMLITADHGNVEQMANHQTGQPHTAHTTCKVPLVLVNSDALDKPMALKPGRLADIAPTLLSLIGVDVPSEMTGEPLASPLQGGPDAVAAE